MSFKLKCTGEFVVFHVLENSIFLDDTGNCEFFCEKPSCSIHVLDILIDKSGIIHWELTTLVKDDSVGFN